MDILELKVCTLSGVLVLHTAITVGIWTPVAQILIS